MELNDTLTDESKEREGVVVPFGVDGTIKVRRMYTPDFNRVHRELSRPHGRAVTRDAALAERILVETMAECVLIGWTGLTVGGKEIKFSKANAKELLTKFDVLREAVVEAASDRTRFRLEEQEEVEGN